MNQTKIPSLGVGSLYHTPYRKRSQSFWAPEKKLANGLPNKLCGRLGKPSHLNLWKQKVRWERGPLSMLSVGLHLSKLELWRKEATAKRGTGWAMAISSLWPQHLVQCLEHSRCSINLYSRNECVHRECSCLTFTQSWKPCSQLGERQQTGRIRYLRPVPGVLNERHGWWLRRKVEIETQPSVWLASHMEPAGAWEEGHRSCRLVARPSVYPEMPSL